MASIGPELPPHLLRKRKHRGDEGDAAQNTVTSEQRPSSSHHTSSSSSPEAESKRRRTIGPPRPNPATQGNQAANFDGKDESDDESEYGPSMPVATCGDNVGVVEVWPPENQQISNPSEADQRKPQRDEWMTLPPKQDDLAARMDPTQTRARKFNTGKGAKGPGHASKDDNTLWTETPEQKRKRLENEQLGITPSRDTGGEARESLRRRVEEDDKARKIREHNEKHRARSLLSQHQAFDDQTQQEDDPNKRVFDYDKDMGAAAKVGHAQKRELLSKAAQFGSRFSGGGFL